MMKYIKKTCKLFNRTIYIIRIFKIGYEISLQAAESILKFKKLKKLDISITKTKQVFDLGNLKKLKF
jgi:hypothetical protein